MKPVEFKGHNVVFGQDQPEYQPMPALRMPDGEVITCWEMTEEQLQEVIRTKRVYLRQHTFNGPLQPVMVVAELSDSLELS